MSENNFCRKDFVSLAPYTEYAYFENLVLNAIDTLEINPEEPLEYFMEIKTGNTKKDNSRKYLHVAEDLQISFSNLEKPTVYFELNFREHSIDFYKKLKYLILMTGNILITLNSGNSTSVIEFIKFISRYSVDLPPAEFVPETGFSPLSPFGNEIYIWRGIEYSDGSVEVITVKPKCEYCVKHDCNCDHRHHMYVGWGQLGIAKVIEI
jgi:hypothetical protein